MHYIIDGHNLIGRCQTIRLGDPDDEAQLIDHLHRWLLRHPQHSITVVFDGGVYGHPQQLGRAGIRTLFAHSPQDADARLVKLIERVQQPQQYRVVSSDHAVGGPARERGVQVIDASEFAAQIERPSYSRKPSKWRRPRIEPKVSNAEVDQWLREFGVEPDS
jgi:hypothetical protein